MPSPDTFAKETKRDISQMPAGVLTSKELRDEFSQATFFSATDGNHGRGRCLEPPTVLARNVFIRMPVGSTENRRRHIEDEGAGVHHREGKLRRLCQDGGRGGQTRGARRGHQDTAWEGYEEIPSWIMQGYSTMADEAVEQFEGIPPCVCPGRRGEPGRRRGGILCQQVMKKNHSGYGSGGSRACSLPLQRRRGGRRGDPHCGRRNAHHHGRPVLRANQYHFLGYLKEPCDRLPGGERRCGQKRHAHAGAPFKGDPRWFQVSPAQPRSAPWPPS